MDNKFINLQNLSKKILANKYYHSFEARNSYNNQLLDVLLYNKNTHFVSVFKDYMVYDYIEEFLKRIYSVSESAERLPKIADYYKNYLKFFCHPVFRNFKLNVIVQNYGDDKAEIYYLVNYGKTVKQENKEPEKKAADPRQSKKIIGYQANNSKKSGNLAKDLRIIFNTTVINFIDGKNELKFMREAIKSEHSSILGQLSGRNIFDSFSASQMNFLKTMDSIQTYNNYATITHSSNKTAQKKFVNPKPQVESNKDKMKIGKPKVVVTKTLLKSGSTTGDQMLCSKSRNNATKLTTESSSKAALQFNTVSNAFIKPQMKKQISQASEIKHIKVPFKSSQPITNINLNTINIITDIGEEKLKIASMLTNLPLSGKSIHPKKQKEFEQANEVRTAVQKIITASKRNDQKSPSIIKNKNKSTINIKSSNDNSKKYLNTFDNNENIQHNTKVDLSKYKTQGSLLDSIDWDLKRGPKTTTNQQIVNLKYTKHISQFKTAKPGTLFKSDLKKSVTDTKAVLKQSLKISAAIPNESKSRNNVISDLNFAASSKGADKVLSKCTSEKIKNFKIDLNGIQASRLLISPKIKNETKFVKLAFSKKEKASA